MNDRKQTADEKATELYPLSIYEDDDSAFSLIAALRSAFRAGAEWQEEQE